MESSTEKKKIPYTDSNNRQMSDRGWGLGTKSKIDGENTQIEVIHNHNDIQVKDKTSCSLRNIFPSTGDIQFTFLKHWCRKSVMSGERLSGIGGLSSWEKIQETQIKL